MARLPGSSGAAAGAFAHGPERKKSPAAAPELRTDHVVELEHVVQVDDAMDVRPVRRGRRDRERDRHLLSRIEVDRVEGRRIRLEVGACRGRRS